MRSACLVLIVAALGCTDQTPEAPPRPNMTEDSGPPPSRMDAGMAEDPLAPTAQLVSPMPAADPNEDEILLESRVTARCKIAGSSRRGARMPDNSSVRITAESLVDDDVSLMGLVKPGGGRDEYEAEFLLDEFPNGQVLFTCSVNDVSEPPRTGKSTVVTLLDLGPDVKILEPADGSRHALKDPVTFKFEVSPAPVVDGDDEGAAISAVEFRILDLPFEFEEDPAIPGVYTASVDFDDRARFTMAPTDADIVVIATNSRQPTAVQRRDEVDISLDAAGPSITVVAPGNEQIVRGQVDLAVKIADVSGIARDTLRGTINGAAYILENEDWEVTGDMYVAQFDTRATMFTDLTELTINIRASDTVGNESTVDHTLYLDNVPPIVSLDPPPIREALAQSNKTICSDPFDPVGDDATSDLGVVERASMYRALVFERTNTIEGQDVFYLAGVDGTSVRLYARKKDDFPLLIDTDADGKCDDINSEGLDERDRPVVKSLDPMTVRGSSYYRMTADADWNHPDHMAPSYCTVGTATTPPSVFCGATAMTRAIHQPIIGKPPAIYGISPTNTMLGACQGNTWSLEPILREGWACLAATAHDNIGNRGLSRPIRVCIDDGEPPDPPCLDHDADPPPSCVDGCSLPDDIGPSYTLPVLP